MKRPSKLSESLQRHLNAYALAASAAGVGMLALTQPAEAKIIYTQTKKVIPRCSPHNIYTCFGLDLNHDGILDFRIRWFRAVDGAELSILPATSEPNNRIWGTLSGGQMSIASTLDSGVSVGAKPRKFQGKHYAMWGFTRGTHSGSGRSWGQWDNVQGNKYLGLKFYIKKNVHYGWARFTQHWGRLYELTILTGYAYETIPNKPIITGKTKGPDVITVEPGSLGALAAGARLHK